MITEHDLQEAIAECEGQRNPSANTCLKLAAFYTIRDKMYPTHEQAGQVDRMSFEGFPQQAHYSWAAGPVKGNTEFLQAVESMDRDELLPIMDELMTAVQAIVPRLYNGVMRKLTKD